MKLSRCITTFHDCCVFSEGAWVGEFGRLVTSGTSSISVHIGRHKLTRDVVRQDWHSFAMASSRQPNEIHWRPQRPSMTCMLHPRSHMLVPLPGGIEKSLLIPIEIMVHTHICRKVQHPRTITTNARFLAYQVPAHDCTLHANFQIAMHQLAINIKHAQSSKWSAHSAAPPPPPSLSHPPAHPYSHTPPSISTHSHSKPSSHH